MKGCHAATDLAQVRIGFWSLAAFVVMTAGCARGPREAVGHFFESVPGIRHRGLEAQRERPSRVAANAAGSLDDSIGRSTISNADAAPTDGAPSSELPPGAVVLQDPSSSHTTPLRKDPFEEETAAATVAIDRLKQALTADSRPQSAPADPFARQHPARVRIEGLMQQARRALDAGDFSAAQKAAQSAAQWSASTAIEFLPNEERPEELVRRIEAAKGATAHFRETELAQSPADADAPNRPASPRRPNEELAAAAAAMITNGPGEGWKTVDGESLAKSQGIVAANRPLRAGVSREMPVLAATVERTIDDSPLFTSPIDSIPGPPEPALAHTLADSTTIELPAADDSPRLGAVDVADQVLLLPRETAPRPSQVADADPLPAFRGSRTANPRVTPTPSLNPSITLEWTDLWPLAVLGGFLALVTAGLLLRRLTTGH